MGETDETFCEHGDELVEMLDRHTDLGPDSRVFDIGCGYGRLAHALQRQGFEGEYVGIDIQPRQIKWCARRLGSDRYKFRLLDLQNGHYNPSGSGSIDRIELDGEFDVVCAFSLFTHMWDEDVKAYLNVFRRALTPEGTALATFFLIDREWRKLEAAGKVALELPYFRGDHCRYESEDEPLHRVAYDLPWLIRTAIDAGLFPKGPPEYGFWSWRPIERTLKTPYQDALAFRRV